MKVLRAWSGRSRLARQRRRTAEASEPNGRNSRRSGPAVLSRKSLVRGEAHGVDRAPGERGKLALQSENGVAHLGVRLELDFLPHSTRVGNDATRAGSARRVEGVEIGPDILNRAGHRHAPAFLNHER